MENTRFLCWDSDAGHERPVTLVDIQKWLEGAYQLTDVVNDYIRKRRKIDDEFNVGPIDESTTFMGVSCEGLIRVCYCDPIKCDVDYFDIPLLDLVSESIFDEIKTAVMIRKQEREEEKKKQAEYALSLLKEVEQEERALYERLRAKFENK